MSDPLAYQEAWERMIPYADKFSLPFGQMKMQQRGGALRKAAAGGSTEFYDHRQYFPGDDVRHINWAATARSGMVTLKQFQQESSPKVNIYLDASESMQYDSAKWARSLDLLALCGLSVVKAEGQANVMACRGEERAPISFARPEENQWLEKIVKTEQGEFSPPKAQGMPSFHIYITDLLFELDPMEWVRKHCRAQDWNLFFSPTCLAETHPEWEHQSQLIDPETKQRQEFKIDYAFWKSYNESYKRHFSLWRQALASSNGVAASVASEPEFYEAALKEAVPNGLLTL